MQAMTTVQFASLVGMFFTLLVTQLDAIYFLSNRIDAVGARVDRVDDDLKVFYRSLGEHEGRIGALEKR